MICLRSPGENVMSKIQEEMTLKQLQTALLEARNDGVETSRKLLLALKALSEAETALSACRKKLTKQVPDGTVVEP